MEIVEPSPTFCFHPMKLNLMRLSRVRQVFNKARRTKADIIECSSSQKYTIQALRQPGEGHMVTKAICQPKGILHGLSTKTTFSAFICESKEAFIAMYQIKQFAQTRCVMFGIFSFQKSVQITDYISLISLLCSKFSYSSTGLHQFRFFSPFSHN